MTHCTFPARLKAFHPFSFLRPLVQMMVSVGVVGLGLSLLALPALAHHPLGGRLPANFFEGFMSGVAHPVLGPDHFAFVVAAGLLAAIAPRGVWIPVAFVLAGLAGTGMHLMRLNLPAAEFFISASVLCFGWVLAMKQRPNLIVVSGLAALAGLFHGYAYGEAIVGAEMTPLFAYLVGFTCIQLAIALGAFAVGRALLGQSSEQPMLSFRFAGFAISGAGVAFLSGVILG